ncbi:helix-turn-helix transcriptional regulator [Haladaptatus sp. NG-SE-30]
MASPTPLDDIAFLARSPHRVAVLDVLAEGPRTRSEIREVTEISQPTLTRILGGFEDRSWVQRQGQEYSLTPFGSLLAEEFGALHETVETMQQLETIGPHLPLEEMDFDVRLFRNARITVPRPPDVQATIRRGEDLIRDASRVRWLGAYFTLDSLPKQQELVLEQGQTQEIIIASDAFESMLSHSEAVPVVRELLATEGVNVYRYAGEIPFSLVLADDVVGIVPYNDEGVPCALVDTEDETIREWVVDTLDDYRNQAEWIGVDDLPS